MKQVITCLLCITHAAVTFHPKNSVKQIGKQYIEHGKPTSSSTYTKIEQLARKNARLQKQLYTQEKRQC